MQDYGSGQVARYQVRQLENHSQYEQPRKSGQKTVNQGKQQRSREQRGNCSQRKQQIVKHPPEDNLFKKRHYHCDGDCQQQEFSPVGVINQGNEILPLIVIDREFAEQFLPAE